MRGVSVLQLGGDSSSICDHSSSYRRPAGSATRLEEQLSAARSQPQP